MFRFAFASLRRKTVEIEMKMLKWKRKKLAQIHRQMKVISICFLRALFLCTDNAAAAVVVDVGVHVNMSSNHFYAIVDRSLEW